MKLLKHKLDKRFYSVKISITDNVTKSFIVNCNTTDEALEFAKCVMNDIMKKYRDNTVLFDDVHATREMFVDEVRLITVKYSLDVINNLHTYEDQVYKVFTSPAGKSHIEMSRIITKDCIKFLYKTPYIYIYSSKSYILDNLKDTVAKTVAHYGDDSVHFVVTDTTDTEKVDVLFSIKQLIQNNIGCGDYRGNFIPNDIMIVVDNDLLDILTIANAVTNTCNAFNGARWLESIQIVGVYEIDKKTHLYSLNRTNVVTSENKSVFDIRTSAITL